MINDPLDLLFWSLRLQEVVLRFHGFRHRVERLGPARFGYYVRNGQTGSPPLVLLHGIALFLEWWSPLLKRLPREYPVTVPELLGFGRSPGLELEPERFTLELYRRQIKQIKESLGFDRMILAGVSLGGWVCLDYALAYPEDLEGMILFGPAGAEPGVDEEELRTMRRVFDYQTPEDFNRLINEYVLYRPLKIPRWVGAQAVRRSKRNGHKHLLRNLTFEDWVGDRVKAIDVPTALIWGREDKVFSFAIGEELCRIMPRARLFPLEKAGHSYLFEKPKAACKAFFEALDWVK